MGGNGIMGFGAYYFIGRARGKDVLISGHAFDRVRGRGVGEEEIVYTLRHPWKRLRDTHSAILPGFRRYVYVSRR